MLEDWTGWTSCSKTEFVVVVGLVLTISNKAEPSMILVKLVRIVIITILKALKSVV